MPKNRMLPAGVLLHRNVAVAVRAQRHGFDVLARRLRLRFGFAAARFLNARCAASLVALRLARLCSQLRQMVFRGVERQGIFAGAERAAAADSCGRRVPPVCTSALGLEQARSGLLHPARRSAPGPESRCCFGLRQIGFRFFQLVLLLGGVELAPRPRPSSPGSPGVLERSEVHIETARLRARSALPGCRRATRRARSPSRVTSPRSTFAVGMTVCLRPVDVPVGAHARTMPRPQPAMASEHDHAAARSHRAAPPSWRSAGDLSTGARCHSSCWRLRQRHHGASPSMPSTATSSGFFALTRTVVGIYWPLAFT